jgi:hypothetical protein
MKLLRHFLTITVVALAFRPGLMAQRSPAAEPSSKSAAPNREALTGVIGDALCGWKHAMPRRTNAECTRECVRRGSQHALIVGEKVYILEGARAGKLDELAGARVLVSGTVQGDTIRVKSVTLASLRPSHSKP